MWKILGLFWIATLSTGVESVAEEAATKAAAVLRFTFAPPDDTRFTQSLESTREKRFDGLGTQSDWSRSETSVSYRHVPKGFLMEARPISMEMTRDGKPLTDPVFELLGNVVVRYQIDLNGQLVSIEGYEGLLERLTKTMPPAARGAQSAVLSEEALIARETAEWNGRIGDFASAEVRIGESFKAEVPFALPDGTEILYRTMTWFPGFEPCAAGKCVRVELRYDSDPEALEGFLPRVMEGVGDALGTELSFSASGTRISGGASRLIDPATMLIYEETVHRTIAMEVEIPGVGMVPSLMREQRKYSFEYEPSEELAP